MKSFKQYLTESKKTYEFKVKIAGETTKHFPDMVKAALSPFQLESCSSGKSSPIQERQSDFPQEKNVSVTHFDVSTAYPATSAQVRDAIAEESGLPHAMIVVRTMAEEEEYRLNHKYDTDFGEQIIGSDYPASNNQDIVGEKHLMSFLKDLSKTKHAGEEVTGYNDQILAKGAPKHVKETPGKQVEVKTKFANLFDKTTKVDPIKGVK
jgi:hypothetical protein